MDKIRDHERASLTEQSSVIEDLIRRLEKATGPDLDLDHSIAGAIRPTDGHGVLLYTASIDAALTLVPEGWCWGLFDEPTAWVWPTPHRDLLAGIQAEGATPAIALCIASLKARLAAMLSDDRRELATRAALS